LTYPQGHKKEGQPLDKICIIGQSGTGKTNLLEIIRDKQSNEDVKTVFRKEEDSSFEKMYFSAVEKNITQKVYNNTKMSKEDKKLIDNLERTSHELLIQDKGDYSISDWQHHSIGGAIKSIKEKYNSTIQLKDEFKNLFININDSESWKLLKEKIDNYTSEKKAYKIKLYDESIKDPNYFRQSIIDMKKWEEENENILEKIEKDINSIIIKFNLQLQINENTQSYDELIIKDLSNENIIEYDDLSTGTKNLLSTFIPLKSYNPKDSIILIDEPENSFYPDIQRELTDLYMNIGENNQLIMATHSPLIASSFEPWEVVELKFDKNNQIYREKYYEGEEDHIDNYFLNPQLLTWTNILTQIFDLKEKSNSDVRKDKLIEYATLKAQIKVMDNQEDKIEKAKELHKLSKLLGLGNNETNI
jgi:ABC-type lipoprotein export system ATPase subunit